MDTLTLDLKAGFDFANDNLKVRRRPLAYLSVIVPVGPDETSWPRVLGCLSNLPEQAEVVLVGTNQSPSHLEQIVRECGIQCHVSWISTCVGRARLMNEGVAATSNPFLWFLHADSELNSSDLQALDQSLETAPEALHYFQLEFKDDGPQRMNLNTRGVRFRSRVLRLPFGDQGLCLSRETFVRLGSFNESVPYGEDHLLVWAAHRAHVLLCEVNAKIVTSSRRYRESGWLLTTLRNFGRTWYQALPQWVALLWSQRR